MPKGPTDGVEVGGQERCPCNSGALYQDCCKSSISSLIRLPNGIIVDQRPLTDEASDAIDGARAEFERTFGRKPQKSDRVFSAAHLDPDNEILRLMLQVAEDTSTPQLAYAYQKTGLIITEDYYPKLSARDKCQWDGAIEQYYDLIEQDVDPFTGLQSSVRDLLDNLDSFRSDCAVHFGSYVDRHRKGRHLEIHEFSQVLALSRVQKILLLLKDKLSAFPKADALVLIRSMFEIYFVYQFLERGRASNLYFLARASSKDGSIFEYRSKDSGKVDKSRVVFVQSGEEVPSHISFYSMAQMSPHASDSVIFDKIYARLSEEVHFSYGNWIDYWRDQGVTKSSVAANPAEVASLFLLSVAMLLDAVAKSSVQTKAVRRDARFLFQRARVAFLFLLGNLEEAPSDIFYDECLLAEIVDRLRDTTGKPVPPSTSH